MGMNYREDELIKLIHGDVLLRYLVRSGYPGVSSVVLGLLKRQPASRDSEGY